MWWCGSRSNLTVLILAQFIAANAARADLWSAPTGDFTDALDEGFWDSGTGSGYTLTFGAPPSTTDVAPVHGTVVPHGDRGKIIMFETRSEGIVVFDLNGSGPAYRIPTCDNGPTTCEVSRHCYFCSSHVVLPESGDVLILGANLKDVVDGVAKSVPELPRASIFDVSEDEFVEIAPMPGFPRYYPTSLVQPDGSTLVVGGDYWIDSDGDSLFEPTDIYRKNHTWLQFDVSGGDAENGIWCEVPNKLGTGEILQRFALYPYMQSLPEGLFWGGPIKQTEAGTDSSSWYWPFSGGAAQMDPRKVLFRARTSQVQLGLNAADPQPLVMLIGGADADRAIVTETAEIWDGERTPGSRWVLLDPMSYKRTDLDATLLPNGHVLVVGGMEDDGETFVFPCETFIPDGTATYGSWQISASIGREREYHSVVMLLPDGRVIAAGGENRSTGGNTYEVYYPPYLFIDNGSGPELRTSTQRPQITAVQTHGLSGSKEVYYGHDFTIDVTDIDLGEEFAVALMRPCSVTHSLDMNQRLVYAVAESTGVGEITVDGSSLTPELSPP
jgi:hypothetical protein